MHEESVFTLNHFICYTFPNKQPPGGEHILLESHLRHGAVMHASRCNSAMQIERKGENGVLKSPNHGGLMLDGSVKKHSLESKDSRYEMAMEGVLTHSCKPSYLETLIGAFVEWTRQPLIHSMTSRNLAPAARM